ncbi:MAG: HAD-IG family 5'-nucleotidase [Myxococcales bacterium]|nr:HAD-IG family 5'-nucleotidase [Myxococcota bacterium]MDW8282126.1 HAD-IG family 5'-nucleotidase [Myxococcales bacterium]
MSAREPVASSGPTAAADAPHLRLLQLLGRAVQQLDPVRHRRVFVNRTLRMDRIEIIGFDMDYTLAIYNQPRIEALSVACTLRKMVNERGYPQEILGLHYDPQFAIRGLVVDRHHGNILKMDRYGYVGRCYHGARLLDREERGRLYRDQRVRLSQPRYAWIDTLFALPEAVLYARNVEILDRELDRTGASAEERMRRYDRLWTDIRECIDEAHHDESIKRVIKANLSDYLEKDPDLAPTLHRFRSAGRRLFLLTNSGLDYTDRVMSYLLDGELPAYPSWRSYFDVIVVEARKPQFFTERAPLYELDAQGRPRSEVPPEGPLLRSRIYQGGNVQDFQVQIGGRGDRILYVGDHIYGDMLRAKKSSVWRTAMIIQELEDELTRQARVQDQLQWLEALERRRTRIESELSFQQLLLRQLARGGLALPQTQLEVTPDVIEAAMAEIRRRIEALRAAHRSTVEQAEAREREIDRTFNPYWGPLFKEGTENSRFGDQVEDYACLYTSRVSNFLAYSPLQHFRSPRDHLPHERVY